MKLFETGRVLVTFLLALSLSVSANTSLSERLAKIEELRIRADDGAYEALSRMVSGLGRHLGGLTEDEQIVYDEARATLLALPGHAEFAARMIETERAALGPKDVPGTDRGGFDRRRGWYLEALQHLPSPETVRVLGEMLHDTRDDPPPRKPGEDFGYTPSNAALAARTLTFLKIKGAPVQREPLTVGRNDIEPWRIWYEQVKAGTRSFRFEGDNREYRLAEPPPLRTRPAKDKLPEHGAVAAGPPSSVPWPWVLGGVGLLLASLGWYLAKRRACA